MSPGGNINLYVDAQQTTVSVHGYFRFIMQFFNMIFWNCKYSA